MGRCMKVEMVLELGKDDMPRVMGELQGKYKPKQLFFYECEYYTR